MQNCEWCNYGGFHISVLEIILRKCICQGKLWPVSQCLQTCDNYNQVLL